MAVDQPTESHKLSKLQIFAVTIVGIAAIGLAVYGAATSYISVRDMAHAHNVPLWRLTPIGIDGGLLTVVALDIVLTWIGYPLAAIRWLARLFSLATVGANALSGWPDPIAVGLHITPSVLLVIVVEGVRAVLLRNHHKDRPHAKPENIEPIPWLRWVLAPTKTFALWRRMVLWHVPSYSTAIDLELSRRQAIVRLKAHFGPEWKRKADNDLLWMLRSGVRIPEACARVELIVSPKPSAKSERPPAGSGERPAGRSRNRTRHHADARNGAPGNARNGATAARGNEAGNGAGTVARNGLVSVPGTDAHNDADDPAKDPQLMAEGRKIMTAWTAQHGGQITLDEFTPRLGRKRSVASRVRRALLEESDSTTAVAR